MRVCGFGVFLHPAFLVGMLGRVPSCARPVRFPPLLAWAACGVGLCGGRRGRGFSPPVLFVFFLAARVGGGGGSQWCLGSVVFPAAFPSLDPLVSVPPSPFVWVAWVFFSRRPVARHFSSRVCASVSGVSFPPALRQLCGRCGPLLLAGCRRVPQGGPPMFFRGGPRVSPLVLPGWGVTHLL